MQKELKKLNRKEILEILLEQAKLYEQSEKNLKEAKEQLKEASLKVEELEKENYVLSDRLERAVSRLRDARSELDCIKIDIQESGSIAEASLKINEMFETAQKTVDDYMSNTKRKCDDMVLQTREQCRKSIEEASAQSDAYWDRLSDKLEAFYNAHAGIRELLASVNINVPDKKELL